jgi:CheY-like chemotaxis protein
MKALIVDDEAVARTALREALSAQGKLRFEECEDGEAAWNALDGGLAPAICLFDVRMPTKNGIDLLSLMRKDPRFAGIPVLLVTASAAREVVVKAGSLGLDGILIKPIERRQVSARVFPILQNFIDALLAPPARTRQKLGINAQKYQALLETVLRKGQEAVSALKTGEAEGLRLAHVGIASMRTTAGALGAAHLDAALARALDALEGDFSADSCRKSAGIVEVGLSLFRDGLDWQGISLVG